MVVEVSDGAEGDGAAEVSIFPIVEAYVTQLWGSGVNKFGNPAPPIFYPRQVKVRDNAGHFRYIMEKGGYRADYIGDYSAHDVNQQWGYKCIGISQ
jgi:hypothetical protein